MSIGACRSPLFSSGYEIDGINEGVNNTLGLPSLRTIDFEVTAQCSRYYTRLNASTSTYMNNSDINNNNNADIFGEYWSLQTGY